MLCAFSALVASQDRPRTLEGLSPEPGVLTRPDSGSPEVSFWRHPKNLNVMRLEAWPDGEMRFWAHRLDPEDETTRKVLAKRGLEIDADQMTSEYVLRFCGFGHENGLRYVEVESRPGDDVFNVIVAVGFDFFRGVASPKYGDTRWRVSLRRTGANTLHIEGRLVGWRGILTFGQIRADAELIRMVTPPRACEPAPVYAIRPASRRLQ